MARPKFSPGDVVRIDRRFSDKFARITAGVQVASYDAQLNDTATVVRRSPYRIGDLTYYEVDLAPPNFGRVNIPARHLHL